MLCINIYDNMQSFADIRWDVVIYSTVVILIIFGLGLLTAILITKQQNRRGVILQCAFRSNFAIIGLTLVGRLGGDEALGGIISAFSIPVFNILAVVALSIFTEKEQSALGREALKNPAPTAIEEGASSSPGVKASKSKNSIKSILLNIVKNPLIIGVAVGLVLVGIREIERACGWIKLIEDGGVTKEVVAFRLSAELKFLYTAIKDLKAIASPLALIVLGGQFEFSAVKGMTKEIIAGTIWRIVVAPLIGIGVAILLSNYTDLFTFDSTVYPTLIALFGTPVAVSSAIMAGEMKNDEQLATQLVVWTSIGSIITIFVIVFALMSFGLLAV